MDFGSLFDTLKSDAGDWLKNQVDEGKKTLDALGATGYESLTGTKLNELPKTGAGNPISQSPPQVVGATDVNTQNIVKPTSEQTKTLVIVGAVAVIAYLVFFR